MTPVWEVLPLPSAPGELCQLRVIDREDGARGRTVCIVPGNLDWQASEQDIVLLIDQQDLVNAVLIAAAPRMRAALQRLAVWANRMGGWDAPCWEEAQAVLASLPTLDAPARSGS